jgi:hypothetical protein
MFNRKSIGAVALTILTALALVISPNGPGIRIVHAQFVGSTQVPGYAAGASNASAPAVIGNALAVTNPASNFLVLVQGGPIFCSGALAEIAQSTIQLTASTTYLIVANCAQQNVYAKTAVTGPGSPAGQPGVPATILAAVPGLEVPVATVVCNATACGNGGNGTITDNRPLANFPALGTPLNTIPFANLSTTNATDGSIIYCSTCAVATAPCTGASTGALAIRVNATWRCQ